MKTKMRKGRNLDPVLLQQLAVFNAILFPKATQDHLGKDIVFQSLTKKYFSFLLCTLIFLKLKVSTYMKKFDCLYISDSKQKKLTHDTLFLAHLLDSS